MAWLEKVLEEAKFETIYLLVVIDGYLLECIKRVGVLYCTLKNYWHLLSFQLS